MDIETHNTYFDEQEDRAETERYNKYYDVRF
jgi:hypothetical protein